MNSRRLTTALMVLSLSQLVSCAAYYTSSETQWTGISYSDTTPSCTVRDVALTMPAVGLFVGVTNYPDSTGLYSTPAHMIGANLVSGFFNRAGYAYDQSTYDGLRITDLPDRDEMPENYTDPMSFVGRMGYGGGGSGHAVPKAQIKAALHERITLADEVHSEHGEVLLIVYIAAHGVIAADGRPYLLPTDVDPEDPETWIAYQSVIGPIETFLNQSDTSTDGRHALVIFDTCQQGRSDTAQTTLSAIPNLTIIQAAAPGQYAWHWTSRQESSTYHDVVSETRIGFGGPPPAQQGLVEQVSIATMSVLPIANQCFMKDAAAAPGMQLTIQDWFEGLDREAQTYLERIPEMQRAERQQDISILTSEDEADLLIFQRPVSEDEVSE